jgi:hypothetical protein
MGQLNIGENTIALLLKEGMWFRLGRWKQEGYWITWSTKKRFGERFGYEKAIWQIGRGKWFRIACFFLETPSWYYVEKEKVKLKLVK